MEATVVFLEPQGYHSSVFDPVKSICDFRSDSKICPSRSNLVPQALLCTHAGMAKFLSKLGEPIWNWASRRYQAAVAKELKKYGLRYDDLFDEMYDVDIQEALSRLPKSAVDARSARLKRAMDCSMKHVYLPKELQAKQTPYEDYLQDALKMVKLERKERTELGSSMPYNREIP